MGAEPVDEDLHRPALLKADLRVSGEVVGHRLQLGLPELARALHHGIARGAPCGGQSPGEAGGVDRRAELAESSHHIRGGGALRGGLLCREDRGQDEERERDEAKAAEGHR